MGIMAVVTAGGMLLTLGFGNHGSPDREDTFTIVTSFYPVYIAAENVVDGVRGVSLLNLTENNGGCLHDYQLTTADMKKLEQADLFIMNGAGMESFIHDIINAYPDLTIVDTSQSADLLESVSEHHHEGESEEEHEEHAEEMVNGHIWMNPANYVRQVEAICQGLSAAYPEGTTAFEKNTLLYKDKVEELGKELDSLDCSAFQQGVVIFHDAFAYLAERLSIQVVHAVSLDNDTALSAGEVAEIVDEIRENNVRLLFTEKQFSDAVPSRIAEETKAEICVIDSLVSGSMDKDAYLDGLKEDIQVLKKLLGEMESR